MPVVNEGATRRVSGHTLRVTGAQGLTRLGFPLWAIQLLGRWGSDAVKGYLREAPLAAMLTAAPALALDIDAIVQAVLKQLPAAKSSEPRVLPTAEPIAHLIPTTPLPDPAPLIRAEVARSVRPSQPASAVRNDRSGILHLDASGGFARCGWRYQDRPHTKLNPAPPRGKGIWCNNCRPEPRGGGDESGSEESK